MPLEAVGSLGDTTNHPLVGIVMSTAIFTTTEDITTITTTVEITMDFAVVGEDIMLGLRMEVRSIVRSPTVKTSTLTRIFLHPNQ
jgi:hypothetical protein